MSHNPDTYAYGEHWSQPTEDQDPQPQGKCDDCPDD